MGVLFSKFVCQNGRWGVFSLHPQKLSITIPCEYDEILYDYRTGIEQWWLLKKDGKWGAYRISKRQFVIPFIFDDADGAACKCEEIEKA